MTAHVGEAAALTTAVCWSFTALFFSYGGRRIGSDIVNRSRLLFALCLLAVTHLAVFGRVLPVEAGADRWAWLALSSVLGLVVGDAALFQAYVLVGARIGALMMSLVPLIGALLARLLLDESLAALDVCGILVTVSAVAWVVTDASSGATSLQPEHYRRGLLLGLVGAAGQASNLIAARVGMAPHALGEAELPALSASLIRILVATAIMWGISAVRGDVPRVLRAWRDRRALSATFAGAFVGPYIGVSLSMLAIQRAHIGVAATLMALPPVLLIPIEYVLLGRRVSWRAVVGTLVAFLGVALILLSG